MTEYRCLVTGTLVVKLIFMYRLKGKDARIQKCSKNDFEPKIQIIQTCIEYTKSKTLERRVNLCLNFAQRSMKHPTMKKMFPLNEKIHLMGTRNPQKFKVQFAHNERLRKSPIVYMQNLLNEHELQ